MKFVIVTFHQNLNQYESRNNTFIVDRKFYGFFYPRSEEEGISLSVGLAVRPYVRPFVTHFCRIFSATINCKGLKSKKHSLFRLAIWWDLFLYTPEVTFLVTSWFLSQ